MPRVTFLAAEPRGIFTSGSATKNYYTSGPANPARRLGKKAPLQFLFFSVVSAAQLRRCAHDVD